MKTNIKLSFVLILLCCLGGWGQKQPTPNKQENYKQETILKKQIAVDDLENQVKEISFAVVRVFLRTKIAAWLWKDGKDETGRAESLAVKAVDELYEKKNEIPNIYFSAIKSELFNLLETNSKETAKRLREKYDSKSEDDLIEAHSLLEKKDGEKLVAEKILKSLVNLSELSIDAALLLDKLQTRKSPEAARILMAILVLEESGKSNFSATDLYSIVHNFLDSSVSPDLQKRFFKIVLSKARNAFNFADSNVEAAYNLLRAVMSDIKLKAPDLFAEASGWQLLLGAKISKKANESKEREQRINESADKLGAIISEAEKADDEGVKYLLYVRAAKLSLERQKFALAVELAEKTIAGDEKAIPKTFREQWFDQFLGEIVIAALKKDEIDSARYAIKKMIDKLSMADSLLAVAKYYSEKDDTVSAINVSDEAFNLTKKTENGNLKIHTLFRLISAIQKIDKTRIFQVTAETSKVINSIPTLKVDDKPETKNYENYVNFIMATNLNLLPVITALAREEINEATSFANRIGKKEIKIIADFALLVESFKNRSKLPTAKNNDGCFSNIWPASYDGFGARDFKGSYLSHKF